MSNDMKKPARFGLVKNMDIPKDTELLAMTVYLPAQFQSLLKQMINCEEDFSLIEEADQISWPRGDAAQLFEIAKAMAAGINKTKNPTVRQTFDVIREIQHIAMLTEPEIPIIFYLHYSKSTNMATCSITNTLQFTLSEGAPIDKPHLN